MYSLLSCRQHVSECCPLDKSPRKFGTGDLRENLSRKYKFVVHRKKISEIYIKTSVGFILLAIMYVAEQQTEDIVAVPRQSIQYVLFCRM